MPPPVAVSRVGCCELSLACSSVTAKSSRSCYIVSMPTNLHRYYGAGYSHFITTSCYQRRPLLGTPRSRDLFLEVMEQIRQRHQFVVVGYVVMPEHVHLLFTEPERGKPTPKTSNGISAVIGFAQSEDSSWSLNPTVT
jgi:REP element-mobilizing transposase RayT